MTKLASVINFCTYDLRFLDRCIQGVAPFSSQILIPVCDHFFNGEEEDLPLLRRIYKKYPGIDFIEFAYSEDQVYGTPSKLVPYSPGWSQHWHNSARLIATYYLNPEIEKVVFLDVDEIFSSSPPQTDHSALRLATYWYFQKASQCATVYPDGPLIIDRDLLATELLLNQDERMGMFDLAEGKKEREFLVEQKPIVHHYSWVRTREELEKKISAWGHHWERDWKELIKREDDFVRGYSYREIEPFWDPLEEEIVLPEGEGEPSHSVDPKEIFRKEINAIIQR